MNVKGILRICKGIVSANTLTFSDSQVSSANLLELLGLKTKSGKRASGTFSGNPKKSTVTFATAFADANYSVSIIGVDARTWNIETQTAGGFVINTNANQAPTGDVSWTAIAHGES